MMLSDDKTPVSIAVKYMNTFQYISWYIKALIET